jgi:hypothetical protein
MVSQILYGEQVEVIDIKDNFTKIKMLFDGYEGWCDTKHLTKITDTNKRNILTKSFGVYDLPEGRSLLSIGSEVTFFEEENHLLENLSESLVETAKNFLNVPYLWGGRSFFGIDCSGFTQLVYKVHGISLPRDAYQQAEVGKVLDFVEESKPGDLAFFENEEGKIFIESNGWCTMAGIGLEEGMVAKALDSVKERLDCEHGIVLNNPAFTKYYIEYGEISSYPPGYKENAGIFCHNNPWIMIGETVQGRGDRAWEYFRKICPSYTEEISDLHKVEPYVYAQMIAGKDAFKPGEAKNSWLTGTAAWNYYAITQYILGIQPTYKGLRIEPCIAPEWKGFAVTRKFRGATYLIEVKNPNGAMKGVASLTVDGKLIEGNIIPLMPEGRTYKVEVLM